MKESELFFEEFGCIIKRNYEWKVRKKPTAKRS
jgi:hypothetical protein